MMKWCVFQNSSKSHSKIDGNESMITIQLQRDTAIQHDTAIQQYSYQRDFYLPKANTAAVGWAGFSECWSVVNNDEDCTDEDDNDVANAGKMTMTIDDKTVAIYFPKSETQFALLLLSDCTREGE